MVNIQTFLNPLFFLFYNKIIIEGGGTCLEALRSKKTLIAIINDTLMDNH